VTGLHNPLSLIEARTLIFSHLVPTQIEKVPLEKATGRVLREDLVAPFTSPEKNLSTMDGYAVSGLQCDSWSVIGEIPAGTTYDADLSSGNALRVFTGSQLPQYTDAVIPQELISLHNTTISIAPDHNAKPKPLDFILAAGSDFQKNQTVLSQTRRISARDVSLAASLGYEQIAVSKSPRVTLISTGSELILPGKPLKQGQIYASNAFALASLVDLLGGKVLSLPPLVDNKKLLIDTLAHALETSDLIVTIGGASVGNYDLVKPALAELNARLLFQRVNTRPGRPTFFALNNHNIPVLGLPGNPASCMVGSWIYLADIIRALSGLKTSPQLSLQSAVSLSPLPQGSHTDVFLRATFSNTANLAETKESEHHRLPAVSILPRQESGLNLPTAHAQILVFRKAHAHPLSINENVPILLPPHSFL
jgi:molybdopterin molybdotransferase